MDREQLRKVDQKVDLIIPHLRYTESGFVDTKSLINSVSQEAGVKISFRDAAFSSIREEIKDFGAMMCVTNRNGQETADIIVNSEKDVIFRRFSLAHELGHLMVDGMHSPKLKMSSL